MRRLLAVTACTVLAATAALLGLVTAPAYAVEVAPNDLFCERVVMLQGYIEHYAADHGGTYPEADMVLPGGGLEVRMWPENPWTGAPLQPGSAIGDYSYVRAADGTSYTLTGFKRRRPLLLHGGGATSLDAERDARAAEAADLLRQYVFDYARDNNFTAPSAAQMAATGAVGTHVEAGAWPKNPWTGTPMKGSSAAGDFTYTRDSDGHHFSLVVKTSSGVVTVTGDTHASPWKARRDIYRDQITKDGVALIRDAVEQWAFDNNDWYPDELEVGPGVGVGMFFVDLDWPVNPVANAPMADEGGTGSFNYELSYGGGDPTFSIAALLSSGTFTLGPSFEESKERRFRFHYKDLCAQSGIQVIKAYIDQYALENGGALPAASEVTRHGGVGSGHAWWPTNPWALGDMVSGTAYGEYTYTPGTGGSYTLVLHEEPDPEWPALYPADYAAQ